MALRQMIRSAGFCEVHIRVDEFSLRFIDAGEWWHWAWSHGFRQVIEPLTGDQLRVYRETAFRLSAGVRGCPWRSSLSWYTGK